MGIFKLNGIDYMGGGGGGNTNYEELTQLEYDALTEEEKNNGTIYFITDANSNQDGKFQPIIYSEEEREIGVWTDGKPLYQKTIEFGVLPNNTSKSVNHNISNLGYIADIRCVAYNPTSGYEIHIPYASRLQASNQVQMDVNTTSVNMITAIDLSVYTTCYVTLQYTKTTDSPGSGQWTPQGVPAHHYSTEEQIVGTWIDGKPIYEVSYERNTAMSSGDTVITNLMSDCETVVNLMALLHDFVGTTPIWTLLPVDDANATVYTDGDNVRITLANNYAINRAKAGCMIVVQFTKTTS